MRVNDRAVLMEKTDEVLSVLMDRLNCALFMIDPENSRIIEVNDKAAELLGYSKHELKNLNTQLVFSSEMHFFWQSIIEKNKPTINSFVLLDKDGLTHLLNFRTCLVEYQDKKAILEFVCNSEQTIETAKNPPLTTTSTDTEFIPGLIETTADYPSIIGQSGRIREVCSQIGLVAKTDATVLVQGETGTGKELVAQAVHFHSERIHGPLIKVNCAALTETLLESELFGHKKGAFTGAVQDRKGRFKLADGGTLILDEIGCMSLSGQAKLLRVLQEREFEPIGDSRSIKVDVRVIAITNADLIEEVEKGQFREDLFYRLNVFPIRLPPLRDRKEDIPLLSRHFLKGYSVSVKKQVEDIDADAISKLMYYAWPGNIRELENTIEYGVILEKGRILNLSSLPEKVKGAAKPLCTLKERLDVAEKQCIREALTQAGGIKKHAAQLLGIDRRNLSYFLNKHGIH